MAVFIKWQIDNICFHFDQEQSSNLYPKLEKSFQCYSTKSNMRIVYIADQGP